MALFRSVVDTLNRGLSRGGTGAGSVTGCAIKRVLLGKPLSAAVLRELEKALIGADVGVKTAIELRKDLQAMWERGEISTGDEALPMLKEQLVAYFPDEDRDAAAGGSPDPR